MRRRTNTYCAVEQPKQIDRFKKRQPPRILFAEEVNYSMSINTFCEQATREKQSDRSSSQDSQQNKQQRPFEFVQEGYIIDESKMMRAKEWKETKTVKQPLTGIQMNQNILKQLLVVKDKEIGQEIPGKRQVVVIGDTLLYEEKIKGFKKGTRRRYSHKHEGDYMTY